MEHDKIILEGPVLKAIFAITLPIIVGNLLQTAYQITDAFWVGRLGKESVAAVSLSFPIIFLIIALAGGIGLAGAVLAAQYKGNKEHEKVDHITGQTFLLAFIFSAVLALIGFIFAPNILKLFGTEEAVFSNAVSYLRISLAGIVFIFGYNVFQSLSRAVGDVKTPVYIVLGTVLLNFVLDPLFIFGYKFIPALGVGGAAMATVFTQGIALFAGLIVFRKGISGINLKAKHFKPDYPLIKKIINLGIPISLEQSSRSAGAIVMTAIVTTFGTIALASYGIGIQIIGLVIIPALSLSIANSALIGQNIGAGNIERAKEIAKKSTIIGFVVLTLLGIVFFIFAKQIIAVFIPSDADVINTGAVFLRTIALTFGLIGVQMSFFGTIRGSGNTSTVMKVSILTMIVQISSAFILSRYILHSEFGIWLGYPIANIVGALVAFMIFIKGDWAKKSLIENPEIKKKIEKECELAEYE